MFSERLKGVRELLGVSQQAMAEKLGVSLRSQQNYEAGSRMPDAAYLAALVGIGVDVTWLLTGQKLRDDQRSNFDLAMQVTLTADQSEEARKRQVNLLLESGIKTAELNAQRVGRYANLCQLLDDCSDESLELLEATTRRLRDADMKSQ